MTAVRTRLRVLSLSIVAMTTAAACSGGGGAPPSPTPASTAPGISPTPSPTPTESPSPSPESDPVELPRGVPTTYREDVEPGDLPPEALIPAGAEITGTDFPGSATVVVTYARGDDPFAREQGLVVWRRFAGEDDPWRARLGFRDPPNAGVLGIQVETADVTGDGEADAISFENVGGSGTCGTWRVIALSPDEDVQTYGRDLCDATVDASTEPLGIRVTESVFGPDDPHCCPSATRATILRWTGSRWRVVSSEET